jgi:hypothetical protein
MASLAETLGYLKNPKGKKTVSYQDWVANNPEGRSAFNRKHWTKLSRKEVEDDEYVPDPNDERFRD